MSEERVGWVESQAKSSSVLSHLLSLVTCDYLAFEAAAMPFGIQGHNGIVNDGFGAGGAAGSIQLLKVVFAVGTTLPLIEGGTHQTLLARTVAAEAVLVPVLTQSLNGALQDGPFAGLAGHRIVGDEAVAADRLPLLDVEGVLLNGLLAVLAGKVLRMPGLAHGGDDAVRDHLVAFVTHRVRLLLFANRGKNKSTKLSMF